jgi:hypothetical protein
MGRRFGFLFHRRFTSPPGNLKNVQS